MSLSRIENGTKAKAVILFNNRQKYTLHNELLTDDVINDSRIKKSFIEWWAYFRVIIIETLCQY